MSGPIVSCSLESIMLQAQQSESFIRQQQRLERSVEQMERTLKHELSAEQMHPAQLKVLSSLQNHWSGLMVFLKHPQVALDNNSGERKLRNPAMLRRNCRGSGSHWSASLAAQMFSIIQSVLLWDLNPHRWLYKYLRRLCRHDSILRTRLQLQEPAAHSQTDCRPS